MFEKAVRIIFLFLLGCFGVLVISGCDRQATKPNSVSQPLVAANCHRVTHAAGETCVPDSFDRLVTLDGVSFEYAIAAGLTPIGAVSSEFQADLDALTTEATDIGESGEPNLEKMLSLQPELVVGLDSYQSIYPQLSQIAPTLLFNFEHSGQWKVIFQQMSAALDRTAAAQAAMAAYYDRAAEFQTQMGERLDDLQVSVIRVYPDTINLYLKDSFCGTVLQDAGLSRPAAQDITAAAANQRFGNPIQASISRELLAQADGDVIFIWSGEDTAEASQQAQQRLQELQQDPLWQQLKAVQTSQVYQVPSYWIGSGPIAANAVFDDLFKYLVEEN